MYAYARKKTLNRGRKIGRTCAIMMAKFLDVQFGIRFSAWNVGSMGKRKNIGHFVKTLC